MESQELPKLEKNDYLNEGNDFWKNYRKKLYKISKEQELEVKKEKTPENIVTMALEKGVKPTARYFNIEPSQVRYWIKKLNK